MAAIARAFSLTARAKFNIRLEVGPPPEAGLHQVRSVVVDLDIGDAVRFAPSPAGFTVTCAGLDIPERDNLAYQAAQALGVPLPALAVEIEKRLPMRAGLGGGSSDAAAVLKGLASAAAAAGSALPSEQLARAAARTGSDVAACLVPGAKLVTGTGDIVRPLGFRAPAFGVVLLKPAVGIDTAQAYRLLDRVRPTAPGFVERTPQSEVLCKALEAKDFAGVCALAHNDFQAVIEAAYPPVSDARRRLADAGAFACVLCGSGSCVAGLFPTRPAAEAALAKITAGAGEWSAATAFADDA